MKRMWLLFFFAVLACDYAGAGEFKVKPGLPARTAEVELSGDIPVDGLIITGCQPEEIELSDGRVLKPQGNFYFDGEPLEGLEVRLTNTCESAQVEEFILDANSNGGDEDDSEAPAPPQTSAAKKKLLEGKSGTVLAIEARKRARKTNMHNTTQAIGESDTSKKQLKVKQSGNVGGTNHASPEFIDHREVTITGATAHGRGANGLRGKTALETAVSPLDDVDDAFNIDLSFDTEDSSTLIWDVDQSDNVGGSNTANLKVMKTRIVKMHAGGTVND